MPGKSDTGTRGRGDAAKDAILERKHDERLEKSFPASPRRRVAASRSRVPASLLFAHRFASS
jgi:hypothetical protein